MYVYLCTYVQSTPSKADMLVTCSDCPPCLREVSALEGDDVSD